MTTASEKKLLLVDDNTTNLQVLREVLEVRGYNLLVAKTGAAALNIAEKAGPDLVLLDIMMPEMDGYEVCRRLKADPATREIPVIFLTALTSAEEEAKGLSIGAVDYITKPINPDLVRARVQVHLELKDYRDKLELLVAERTREIAVTQAVMIEGLATLAEYRDPETGGHIKRTQNYVKALALQLKEHPRFRDKLDDETIDWLYLSAPLHDIGKVGVRDSVLLKAGPLSEEEFEEMKRHTVVGNDALLITERKLGRRTFLATAREIALTHQEKWDGSGYPRGLKGPEIPISGRLMALADVYDALISKRVYKPPFPHEKAIEIISAGSGSHFDPDVVTAFLEIESTFRNIALTFADHDEERSLLGQGSRAVPDDGCRIGSVLLVEDNEINLAIMRSQLEAMGFLVESASNGQEALSKYLNGNVEFVLTDIEMPILNGYELAAEIRHLEKDHSDSTPVIAITAKEFDLNEESARQAGFDDYMLKPLDPLVLDRVLRRLGCELPGSKAG